MLPVEEWFREFVTALALYNYRMKRNCGAPAAGASASAQAPEPFIFACRALRPCLRPGRTELPAPSSISAYAIAARDRSRALALGCACRVRAHTATRTASATRVSQHNNTHPSAAQVLVRTIMQRHPIRSGTFSTLSPPHSKVLCMHSNMNVVYCLGTRQCASRPSRSLALSLVQFS